MSNFFDRIKSAGRWIRDNPDVVRKWIEIIIDQIRGAEKTVRELAQSQIEDKIKKSLNKGIKIVILQIVVLCSVMVGVYLSDHHIIAELFASTVMVCILLYNSYLVLFKTVPDLRKSNKILKGREGYVKSYLARIALAYLFIDGPLILFVVLLLVMGFRYILGDGVEVLAPWKSLFSDGQY